VYTSAFVETKVRYVYNVPSFIGSGRKGRRGDFALTKATSAMHLRN